MKTRDCFETLGLPLSAGRDEIKAAFRRLVKIYHPDVDGGRADYRQFLRVVAAYKHLEQELELQSEENSLRTCPSCGQRAELFEGLDGRAECSDCLLGVSKRRLLLPMPMVEVVRLGAVAALGLGAAGLLAAAIIEKSRLYAIGSAAMGIAGVTVLLVVCMVVREAK